MHIIDLSVFSKLSQICACARKREKILRRCERALQSSRVLIAFASLCTIAGLACAYPYSDPAVFVAEQRGIFYGKTSKQPVRSGLCALGSRIDAMNIDLEHYNALSIR